MRGEALEMPGQFPRCLPPPLLDGLWRVGDTIRDRFAHVRPLSLNPWALLLGKELGVAAGAPLRNRHTDTSVGPDADYIASGSRVADEFHETITIVLRHGY